MLADIHPVQNLRVLKKVSDKQEVKDEWARHWITNGFKGTSKSVLEEVPELVP